MARTPEEKMALDTVLRRGLREGDTAMTGLALDKGADPDLFVRLAAGERNVEIALYRKALAKGADAELMLYSGVESQSRIVVQVAIEDGKASPNIKRTPHGKSSDVPLAEWAYKSYQANIFADLVAKGMDVDMPDAGGNTVLLRAVKEASVDKIDAFLKFGADPLKKNSNGEFPLQQMDIVHRNMGGTSFDNNRSRLIREMLKLIPDDNSAAAPAKTPAAGFNDVATRAEVDVRKPITVVRKKPEEGGTGFKL